MTYIIQPESRNTGANESTSYQESNPFSKFLPYLNKHIPMLNGLLSHVVLAESSMSARPFTNEEMLLLQQQRHQTPLNLKGTTSQISNLRLGNESMFSTFSSRL